MKKPVLLSLSSVFLCFFCVAQKPLIPEPIREKKEYKEILPPSMLVSFNGLLYLAATDASSGYELFGYDGILAPKLEKDIMPGAANGLAYSSYQNFAVSGGSLYFACDTKTLGFQLMSLDSKGKMEALDSTGKVMASFSMPEYITALSGKIYFANEDINLKHSLFVYNPLLHSISSIEGISPVNESTFPKNLCVYQNKLIFTASTNEFGVQLYAYDPIANITTMLSHAYSASLEFGPERLLVTGDKLYFTATTAKYGKELFSYDGKSLEQCTDLDANSGNGVEYFSPLYKDEIYFAGDNGLSGYQLYTYNPNTHKTTLKHTLNPKGHSMVQQYTLYKGLLYFAANPSNKYVELWVTDGAYVHKVSIAEGNLDAGLSDFGNIQVWNEKLYFTTSTQDSVLKLWEFEAKENNRNTCKSIIEYKNPERN